jgi:hypothetical protein
MKTLKDILNTDSENQVVITIKGSDVHLEGSGDPDIVMGMIANCILRLGENDLAVHNCPDGDKCEYLVALKPLVDAVKKYLKK